MLLDKNNFEKTESTFSSKWKTFNKFLGLLSLEMWYRIFVTKEMNSNSQLI
jgi:hypothetical protein